MGGRAGWAFSKTSHSGRFLESMNLHLSVRRSATSMSARSGSPKVEGSLMTASAALNTSARSSSVLIASSWDRRDECWMELKP
jgi:hypothetical protein